MTTYRFCPCFRREFEQRPAGPPPAVEKLFNLYSVSGFMKAGELQRFLREVQKHDEACAEAEAREIVEKHGQAKRRGKLPLDGFFNYLLSEDNLPIASSVHHDMTAPFSHYFIYTGHNSYLTGNQLSSDCSDLPIIEALRRGVRVIELDMWPNSTKDDIDILHGRTLTTPVKLLKCLTSIKDHAFATSPYPVILTLEDHLTPDLQAKVAEMMSRTFGDMLYVPRTECFEEFPSPEELKMKIIISTKPPKEYLRVQPSKDSDLNDVEKGVAEKGRWGIEIPPLHFEKNDQEILHQHEDEFEDEEQKSSQIAAPEYKRLIAISVRKRCGVVDSFKIEPQKAIRLSVSEQLLEKAALSNGSDIIRFTQKNLLRIFPKTTRIMSTNYNPLLGWIHGAQMVAFNMQGHGRPLWLMHGMFKANGASGYVKKPDLLLREEAANVFDPRADLPIKRILKVIVYMGDGWHHDFDQWHFDTYSPPDFYTMVGIDGVPKDTVMKRTRTIDDKWVPIWEEEFLFELTVPELALLRIEVHDYDKLDKDEFAGQSCIPVSELRMGVRVIPLFDEKGEQLKSSRLLMHFEFV